MGGVNCLCWHSVSSEKVEGADHDPEALQASAGFSLSVCVRRADALWCGIASPPEVMKRKSIYVRGLLAHRASVHHIEIRRERRRGGA